MSKRCCSEKKEFAVTVFGNFHFVYQKRNVLQEMFKVLASDQTLFVKHLKFACQVSPFSQVGKHCLSNIVCFRKAKNSFALFSNFANQPKSNNVL